MEPSGALAACFTYGSLMWPDIMVRACGRAGGAPPCEPAWLEGHARHPVVDQDYPGLVKRPGAAPVQGVLYRAITAAELERLDAFEGEEYERVRVTVWVRGPNTGLTEPAWAYRFRPEFAHRLGAGDWSVQNFEAQGKARFCQRYAGFAPTPAP